MKELSRLIDSIYTQGQLFGADHPLPANPITTVLSGVRPNSIAVEGGAFGDEGKGRVVDEVCAMLVKGRGQGVVYRWNGGANAGHTVIVKDRRLALHQLPSGVLFPGAAVVLGKGMVIHPGDVLAEIQEVMAVVGTVPATLMIDEMAVLALDTHRALEGAYRQWATGGRGATGRGISPAYADVLYRHPVRVRDLVAPNWKDRLSKHYDMYAALIAGLGGRLENAEVVRLNREAVTVGAKAVFLDRLGAQRSVLMPYVSSVYDYLQEKWADPDTPFVFEGAQGVGLDARFGIYPDVTASDPTFGGILASTEGVIAPDAIAVRMATIKATYTSSVGTRRLPTAMDEPLAGRIREDAHEYGATTRRPRDIAYIDIPCLRFFAQVSGATHLVLTHLDIAYPDTPIRVCTHYTTPEGKVTGYRPDQLTLDRLTPHYVELPGWDGKAVEGVSALEALPQEARQYVAFLSQALGVTPLFGTTGPQRDAIISWLPG
ncbi:MAG: adenylosuccinate synthetase [Anaerolineae bacterium]|nr:adenylosuccinate synthetase [Anaerolineae bacterium]